jgi:hypothetical protein
MPATSSSDVILAAAQDLLEAIQNPGSATHFAGIDPTQLAALHDLVHIF